MAQIDPRRLMQAAMQAAPTGAAPAPPGGPAGGTPAGPQGGMQDALPSNLAGAQPVGAESSGVLSTADLQNQMGVGTQDQTGQAVGQMIAAIQDPRTPPDQKRMLQQQLQLAALRSLTAGPSGAVGSPTG
jgi:hypothetical protein